MLPSEASLNDLIERLETLRSRSDHFTVNGKLRLAINGFTLPVCPYLGLKIRGWSLAVVMFVFLLPLTSILAEGAFFLENPNPDF